MTPESSVCGDGVGSRSAGRGRLWLAALLGVVGAVLLTASSSWAQDSDGEATFTGAGSNDATLSQLSVDDATYEVTGEDGFPSRVLVDRSADVATVRYATTDPGATVAVTPADDSANLDGHQVPMPDKGGTVDVTLTVTSEDLATSKTYKILLGRDNDPGKRVQLHDLTSLAASGNDRPVGMWSNGEKMWISDNTDGEVYAYDMATKERRPKYDVTMSNHSWNDWWSEEWDFPEGYVGPITSDGVRLWAIDYANGSIAQFSLNGTSHTATEAVRIHDSQRGIGGFWRSGRYFYVPDAYNTFIWKYDRRGGPSAHSFIPTETLIAAGNDSPDAVWSDGRTMWVADGDAKVYAYDMATKQHVPSLSFDVGEQVAGRQRLYALWSDGKVMHVLDTHSKAVYAIRMPVDVQLESLSLGDDVDLLPGFYPGTLDYTAVVPRGVESVTVTAAARSANASVTFSLPDADAATSGHQIALDIGENLLVATVTHGAGTQQYQVNVIRSTAEKLSSDARLSSLELLDSDTLYDVPFGKFSSDDYEYGIAPVGYTDTVTVKHIAEDPAAEVVISSNAPANGDQVDLNRGHTTITVSVTSSDLTSQSTYTVKLFQDPQGTGQLRLGQTFGMLSAAENTNPWGIWSDGTTMWVADHGDDKIYAYDLKSHQRIPGQDIDDLSAAGNDDARGIWSDGTTMWVADQVDRRLYAYDLASGERDSDKDFPSLNHHGNSDATGIWSDGTTMWVVDAYDDKAFAYDLTTKARRTDKDINPPESAGNDSPKGLWSDGVTMWIADSDNPARGVGDYLYAYDLNDGTRDTDVEFKLARGNFVLDQDLSLSTWPHDLTLEWNLTSGANAPRGLWSDGDTLWIADDNHDRLYAYSMPATAIQNAPTLSSLTLSNVDLTAVFSAGVLSYDAAASDGATTTTVTAQADPSEASVSITPADADPSTAGHQVDLADRETRIEVTVTDGSLSQTYTVTVATYTLVLIPDTELLTEISAQQTANTPAEGQPTIDGTARVGETLTADITAISDADGLVNAVFSYQWLADDAAIAGATGSNYTLTDSDAGKTVKVRVDFTDDQGSDESLTSEATDTIAEAQDQPRLARLAFSDIELNPDFDPNIFRFTATVPHETSVTTVSAAGASATARGYVNVSDHEPGTPGFQWGLEVGNNEVQISIFDNGANTVYRVVVTRLAEGAAETPAPDPEPPADDTSPTGGSGGDESGSDQGGGDESGSDQGGGDDTVAALSGSFHDLPASHDGGRFTFEFRLSEAVGLSYVTVRDSLVTAQGANIVRARRLVQGSNLRWEITVEPAGNGDIVLGVQATESCQDAGAVCTADGRKLTDVPEATVSGPAAAPQNSPATGLPDVSGTAQVGETLTADVSAISDADGLVNTVFGYQWLADDVAIAGATGASYTLVDGDAGKTIKVRVDFTDNLGNDESLTSAATGAVSPVSSSEQGENDDTVAALSGSFHDLPASHDGGRFTFEFRLSEAVGLSYVTVRDSLVTAQGANIVRARRLVQGSNLRWEITVEPAGNGDIVLGVQATESCQDAGAVCTADGRKLTDVPEATVRGSN